MGRQPRRLVVAGGSGFIGSRVAQAASEAGWTTQPLTRASHGDLASAAPAWFQPGDVVVYAAGWIPKHGVAADLKPERSMRALEAVCRASESAGVGQLILLSSASVYGTSRPGARSEEDPHLPQGAYGQACSLMEEIVHRLPPSVLTTVVRPFNVYGPGGHGLVDRLLRALANGTPCKMTGGTAVRDYIGVDQVAQAVLRLAGTSATVNLGTGRGRTNAEVVEMVLESAPAVASLLEWPPSEPPGPDASVADVRKAHSLGLPVEDRLAEYIGRQVLA